MSWKKANNPDIEDLQSKIEGLTLNQNGKLEIPGNGGGGISGDNPEVSIGQNSSALGSNSVAIGNQASVDAGADGGIALGNTATVTEANLGRIGSKNVALGATPGGVNFNALGDYEISFELGDYANSLVIRMISPYDDQPRSITLFADDVDPANIEPYL